MSEHDERFEPPYIDQYCSCKDGIEKKAVDEGTSGAFYDNAYLLLGRKLTVLALLSHSLRH
ncbi:hypothetical protein I7Z51_002536 [Vibrio parahaemolyticus]|uniref:hypothetical protein n=1 Tax=Vibrio TaxID=662 RepID=UPI001A8E0D83|nr:MULTISPECIES: hypothetical protein [Vibrio]EGQ7973612.1 hypothetical protein [Vibrio parahaemolyticus]MBO0209819.1 hypothetical protein [Vibrio sp. Vb0877]MCR9811882.1 hypothetical protein [Vibrio parahaemolyticus]MDW2320258.1 hypothetical protein [Vibrio sp. 1159]